MAGPQTLSLAQGSRDRHSGSTGQSLAQEGPWEGTGPSGPTAALGEGGPRHRGAGGGGESTSTGRLRARLAGTAPIAQQPGARGGDGSDARFMKSGAPPASVLCSGTAEMKTTRMGEASQAAGFVGSPARAQQAQEAPGSSPVARSPVWDRPSTRRPLTTASGH